MNPLQLSRINRAIRQLEIEASARFSRNEAAFLAGFPAEARRQRRCAVELQDAATGLHEIIEEGED